MWKSPVMLPAVVRRASRTPFGRYGQQSTAGRRPSTTTEMRLSFSLPPTTHYTSTTDSPSRDQDRPARPKGTTCLATHRASPTPAADRRTIRMKYQGSPRRTAHRSQIYPRRSLAPRRRIPDPPQSRPPARAGRIYIYMRAAQAARRSPAPSLCPAAAGPRRCFGEVHRCVPVPERDPWPIGVLGVGACRREGGFGW